MNRYGLSDPPDLRAIVLGVALLFTASLAVAALSDAPDPTDMRLPAFDNLAKKDARIATGAQGAVISPSPRSPHVVAPPVRFNLPLDACDTQGDCRDNTDDACASAGYVGVKGETVELTETTCSGECSAGCNIHGCPQAIYNCAEPEPDPDPRPDHEDV